MSGRASGRILACFAPFLVLVVGGRVAAQAPSKPPASEPAIDDHARPEELAAARELWTDGLELEKSKKWLEALENFTKVGQIRMTPQVRYHVAFCNEHVGRFVEALNGYQLAVQEARALGDRARDVAENTPARIAAVRGRVARLRIQIDGQLRTSIVLLDGKKLSRALVGHDIPVDPVPHRVELVRAGQVLDVKTMTFSEGATETAVFSVDDPAELESPAAPVLPAAPPVQSNLPSPADSGRLPAYLVAGTGALLLGAGGVFYALREQTIANLRLVCTNGDSGCDPNYLPTENLGRDYTTASRVLFGIGGAALATGITLWFVFGPDEPKATNSKPPLAKPVVGLAPGLGGLHAYGQF